MSQDPGSLSSEQDSTIARKKLSWFSSLLAHIKSPRKQKEDPFLHNEDKESHNIDPEVAMK